MSHTVLDRRLAPPRPGCLSGAWRPFQLPVCSVRTPQLLSDSRRAPLGAHGPRPHSSLRLTRSWDRVCGQAAPSTRSARVHTMPHLAGAVHPHRRSPGLTDRARGLPCASWPAQGSHQSTHPAAWPCFPSASRAWPWFPSANRARPWFPECKPSPALVSECKLSPALVS